MYQRSRRVSWNGHENTGMTRTSKLCGAHTSIAHTESYNVTITWGSRQSLPIPSIGGGRCGPLSRCFPWQIVSHNVGSRVRWFKDLIWATSFCGRGHASGTIAPMLTFLGLAYVMDVHFHGHVRDQIAVGRATIMTARAPRPR